MTFQKITIAATVKAGLSTAWDCYTNPHYITQWNFADDTWHCPTAQNDLKVGGKLRSRMEAKDGSFGFDFEATYETVEKEKKLVYRLDDGREVCTTFETKPEGVEVTTTFDAETQNSLEMQKNGWQAILNNYKKCAEGAKAS